MWPYKMNRPITPFLYGFGGRYAGSGGGGGGGATPPPTNLQSWITNVDSNGDYVDNVALIDPPVTVGVECYDMNGTNSILTFKESCDHIHQTGIFDIYLEFVKVDTTLTRYVSNFDTNSSNYGFVVDDNLNQMRVLIGHNQFPDYALNTTGSQPVIGVGFHTYHAYSLDGITCYASTDGASYVATAFDSTPNNSAPSSGDNLTTGILPTYALYYRGKMVRFAVGGVFDCVFEADSLDCDVTGNDNGLESISSARGTSDLIPYSYLQLTGYSIGGEGIAEGLKATKYSSNPIHTPTGVDVDGSDRYPTVIKVGANDYRMWMIQWTSAMSGPYGTYWTSTDGISWTAPNLGLVSYGGNTNNNLFIQAGSAVTCVADLDVDNWLVLTYRNDNGAALWKLPKDMSSAAIPMKQLPGSVYREYNTITEETDGKWTVYGTLGHGSNQRSSFRQVSLTTDPFGSWDGTETPISALQATSSANQNYNACVCKVEGRYCMLASWYDSANSGYVHTVSLYESLDEGVTFTLLSEDFIDMGLIGEFDQKGIYPSVSVEDDTELRFYYCGTEGAHDLGTLGQIGYASIPTLDIGVVEPTSVLIPAQEDLVEGVRLDATGSPVDVLGTADYQSVHNNSPSGLKATDPKVVHTITVSGTGTQGDGVYTYSDILNGKPRYVKNVENVLYWTGSQWRLNEEGGEYWTSASTGTFPSKTVWTVGSVSAPAPTLAYSSRWVESEEFKENYFDDLAAWDQDSYKERTSVKDATYIRDVVTYSEAPTGADLTELNAYLESRE